MHRFTLPAVLGLFALLLSSCGTPVSPEVPTAEPVPADAAVVRLRVTIDAAAARPAPAPAAAPLALVASAAAEEDTGVAAFGAAQGHLDLLAVRDLWPVSDGAGVVVAVIDSGVDADHPALVGAVLPGWDFVEGRAGAADGSGHGTGVAVLIAGRGPLHGVAPAAEILPLRVLDDEDRGSTRDVAEALLYAADLHPTLRNPTPAQVVNLSLGSYAYSPALHEAVRRVRAAGVVVVAASGNDGARVAFPAALPETLAVGAAEADGRAWTAAAYSGRGAGLDLLAPLGGLIETNRGRYGEAGVRTGDARGGERHASGTSFAAPQVSGLAALLVAVGADGARAETLLRATASDLADRGWDERSGYGLLSPAAALRAARGGHEGEIAVQVLDAGSLQEVAFHGTELDGAVVLESGAFLLRAWLDLDGDGLPAADEPSFRSERLELAPGEQIDLDLTLR